ncbi:hypothetical protein [Pseudonocardia parietis]|uniref:Uncharacterized protein n=1 Tax=Pseudonocardia parietis TaxID=570936 RepID=A0ABS4W6G3_9PSEU|nr:hypothetical protein [Pseudonocardia parietis]MBP2371794.1 hypothetical protein [Pseudonocardia parietis]
MGSTMLKFVTDRAQAAGVAGAVGVLMYALRAHRRSVDRGRAQAARIGLQAAPPNEDGTALLHLRNHSTEPVRASVLAGDVDIQAGRSWRSIWLRSRLSLHVTTPVRIRRTLWPGDTEIVTAAPLESSPALYIADSGGRQWVRASSGDLCQVGHVRVHSHRHDEPRMDQHGLTHPCAGR